MDVIGRGGGVGLLVSGSAVLAQSWLELMVVTTEFVGAV